MRPPSLPGKTLALGDHVRRVAAHPTRPWIAIHRTPPHAPSRVELRDVLTDLTLGTAEFDHYVNALTWVGDRVAVVCDDRTKTLRIDEGGDRIDFVHLPIPLRPFFTQVERRAGAVELLHHGDGRTTTTLLARRSHGLDVWQAAHKSGWIAWHPDGGCRAQIALHPSPTAVEIVRGDRVELIALPASLLRPIVSILGWTAPDRLLGVSGLVRSRVDTVVVWCLTPSSGDVEVIAEVPRVWEVSLSPDGSTLACSTEAALLKRGRLVMVETATGQTVADEAMPRRGHVALLQWLRPQTLVFTALEQPRCLELIEPGRPRLRRMAFDEALDGKVAIEVQTVASRRILVSRSDRPHTPFLSAEVLSPDDSQ